MCLTTRMDCRFDGFVRLGRSKVHSDRLSAGRSHFLLSVRTVTSQIEHNDFEHVTGQSLGFIIIITGSERFLYLCLFLHDSGLYPSDVRQHLVEKLSREKYRFLRTCFSLATAIYIILGPMVWHVSPLLITYTWYQKMCSSMTPHFCLRQPPQYSSKRDKSKTKDDSSVIMLEAKARTIEEWHPGRGSTIPDANLMNTYKTFSCVY